MKKFILISLLSLLVLSSIKAQIKISEMPELTGSPAGAYLPGIKGGVNYKIAANNLMQLFGVTDNLAAQHRIFDLNNYSFRFKTGNVSFTSSTSTQGVSIIKPTDFGHEQGIILNQNED